MYGVAKYAYLCGARIHAETMSLIHCLTPRCSLLLTPLSVCPNGKNTCHTLGDSERKRDGWTPTLTHLPSLCVTLIPHYLTLAAYSHGSYYRFELIWIWAFISLCVCVSVVPLHLSPSCRHTTSASLSSHWSSHMEPHWPACKTSTVPSDLDRPPTNRIGSVTAAEIHTRINKLTARLRC